MMDSGRDTESLRAEGEETAPSRSSPPSSFSHISIFSKGELMRELSG
jgi:hypothetical protein